MTTSSAYAEFSFDNLAANFGTNGRWSLAECPETVQKFFYPRKTFLTLGRIVCCFDDPCSKYLATGQFFFSSLSEKEEKVITFFSNLFSLNCSYGQVECNFDSRYRNILEEGRETNVHLLSEKDTKF